MSPTTFGKRGVQTDEFVLSGDGAFNCCDSAAKLQKDPVTSRLYEAAVEPGSQVAKQLKAITQQLQRGRFVLKDKPAVLNRIGEQYCLERQTPFFAIFVICHGVPIHATAISGPTRTRLTDDPMPVKVSGRPPALISRRMPPRHQLSHVAAQLPIRIRAGTSRTLPQDMFAALVYRAFSRAGSEHNLEHLGLKSVSIQRFGRCNPVVADTTRTPNT